MSEITKQQITDTLTQIVDERSGEPLLTPEMISGIVIRDARVGFSLELQPGQQKDTQAEELRRRCEAAVARIKGVEKVTAVLTAHQDAPSAQPPAAANDQASAHPSADPAARRPAVWQSEGIEGVKFVVAVASGKGGVGKSTTTVNLAEGVRAAGFNVGILDADIYGPSIPRLMGLEGQPELRDGKFIPPRAYEIPCMSMGLITGDDKPVVWRGAMTTKALHQMLRGVQWATHGRSLDLLLIDMPPGTGDIHLTLAQSVPLDGAIMVSTPQDIALLDATKCLQMFRKLHVPVLGMIENMSYFIDPESGNKSYIFGHGGARKAAKEYKTPFLGEVPLDMRIREHADKGEPFPTMHPEDATAELYHTMGEQIMHTLMRKEHKQRA